MIKKEHAIFSGQSSLDVLNLSTNDANKVLEPSTDFSSSDDECFIDLCDKQSAIIISMPQLVKETDSFVLGQNACAENKQLFSIATEKDELNLSTNDANKVQEPSIDFSSSDDECFIDLCDNQSAMIIPMPQLLKETDSFVLDQNICAKNKKLLLPIASQKMNSNCYLL